MKLQRPAVTYVLFAIVMGSMLYTSLNLNTATMLMVSALTFALCAYSAAHLLGGRAAALFAVIALVFGWFAEFMGERYGWFFGHYDYTDALGVQVGGVPIVIPVMWFNLCYIGMLLAFLIIERLPFKQIRSIPELAAIAVLAAVLVTAYDLAADPYMVHVVKGWIMEKTDGWWFGITLQGFVGWITVAFIIVFGFLLATRGRAWTLPADFTAGPALIPVFTYVSWIGFWVLYGQPVETRTISAFAMGTPVLIILFSMKHWNGFRP